MAKAYIIFEDSKGGVEISLATNRQTDCQDEPTMAQSVAASVWEHLEAIKQQIKEQPQEGDA